jgi:hypothetical protein
MHSAALVTKNDLPTSNDYPTMFGEFVVNNPFRIMGLWVDSVSEFGRSLNTTASILSGLYAIQEIVTLPEALKSGWESIAKKVCSLVVCLGYFLETPGLSNSLRSLGGRISPFVPFCNTAYYAFAFFGNLNVVYAEDVPGSESEQINNASQLKRREHKWELAKNGILTGAGVISLVGITLSPPALLAVATSAFGTAMFAHFARSEMIKYSIENNVINITK